MKARDNLAPVDKERVVFAGRGHFITEGGGAAMRLYEGAPPFRLKDQLRREPDPLANDGRPRNTVTVTA